MSTTEHETGGGDAPFATPGSVERVDLQRRPEGIESMGAVAKARPDGTAEIDAEALRAGNLEMLAIVERVEAAMAGGGATVKRLGEGGQIVEEAAPASTRSEEQIIERIRRFQTPPGPIFVSSTYQGWVYMAHVPRYKDRFDAETAASMQGGNPEQVKWSHELGLLLTCLYGRLRAEARELTVVRAYPSDLKKWLGSVLAFNALEETDPSIHEDTLLPLVLEFLTWLHDVTPTAAEIKKYSGLVGTATIS